MDVLTAAVMKVGPFALARALLEVERSSATGVLEVDRGDVTTLLFVERGQLTFAEGGTVGTTLGRTLVSHGVITPQQYQELIMIMARQPAHLPTQRFGELAVAQGFLSAHRLHEALTEQVRIKSAACLAWPDQRGTFREGKQHIERVTPFPTPIADVVASAMRALPGEVLDKIAWPSGGAALNLTLTANANETISRLKPNAIELRMVRMLEGGISVDKLRSEHSSADFEWRGFFGLLVAAGVVEVASSPDAAASSADASVPAAAAPVPREARERAVSAAGNLRHGLGELRGFRERELLKAGVHAPVTTKNSRLLAEQLFQKGRDELRKRAFANAQHAFQEAVDQMPDALEYQLYLAWAEFQLLEDKKQVRDHLVRLEGLAKELLAQDANAAIGHSILGHARMRRGDEVAARKHFTTALRLDPSDVEAERCLRVLALRSKAEHD